MVLLTSGQVSAAISGSIIFTFTLFLFLAGYVLQQQTVRGLQAVIRPRLPTPIHQVPDPEPTFHNPLVKAARPLGQHLPSPYQYLHNTPAYPDIQWSKLAYAQVVRDHSEVCAAVMLFAELAKQKSPASRVMLFPRTWTVDKGEDIDPHLGQTRRLMRLAARRWGVALRPMEPLGFGTELHASVDESLPSSYSLASLWELSEYTRVLYVRGPGVLVSAEGLDALLAFTAMDNEPVAGIPEESARVGVDVEEEEEAERQLSASLLLVNPSMATYHQLKQRRAAHPVPDIKLLREAFPGPKALLSPLITPYFSSSLYASSPALRRVTPAPPPGSIDPSLDDPTAFNATHYLLTTSFILLNDPELPGPEYYVPLREREKWRPVNVEARTVWNRMYDVFRGRRMEVCGMDLAGWEKPMMKEAVDGGVRDGMRHEDEL